MVTQEPICVGLVALPETAGSAIYGMVDVLSSTGRLWQQLVRSGDRRPAFEVVIVAARPDPFNCGHGIPIIPDHVVGPACTPDIVIVPELWLGPDEEWSGRHRQVIDWIKFRYAAGAFIYSACSGAVLLAETGLLDGREATSHWGYEDLFRQRYPQVKFRPEPSLCFADEDGRVVTAGGTTSWHDLALHIISRHIDPAEALRIAKVYLLKTHSEGQSPYRTLARGSVPHEDAAVHLAQAALERSFAEPRALAAAVASARLAERTLKRRFRRATGMTLIEYLQNLRIEAAKRLLEESDYPVDEIAHQVGYEDASFFRRLFKRRVSLTPSRYRRMFAGVGP